MTSVTKELGRGWGWVQIRPSHYESAPMSACTRATPDPER
jgi:hypothetical protein